MRKLAKRIRSEEIAARGSTPGGTKDPDKTTQMENFR